MADPKKKDDENPVNAKIQRKFDLIFDEKAGSSNEEMLFDHSNSGAEAEAPAAHNTPDKTSPKLDLSSDSNDDDQMEFETHSDATVSNSAANSATSSKLVAVPDDNGLDFSLDFSDEVPDGATIVAKRSDLSISATETNTNSAASNHHQDNHQEDKTIFSTDNDLDNMFDAAIAEAQNELSDKTQKTVIFNKNDLFKSEANSTGTSGSTSDLMSSAQAKANIESTIMDILRPESLDSTQEYNLQAMSEAENFSNYEKSSDKSSETPIDHFSENSEMDFDLGDISNGDSEMTSVNSLLSNVSSGNTGEFDISSVDFTAEESNSDDDDDDLVQVNNYKESYKDSSYEDTSKDIHDGPQRTNSDSAHTSYVSDEESGRVQGTIRQLREEREEFIKQIKSLKGESRELEQDNLTLKAALDESKLEISIMRKRHMVEIEDIRYRMSLNEEKKSMAEEKAKISESKREKLEQRIRIDFNQVKQREKELETKLEMLSIDVDSQVNTRDQKILELRRKIDSLEFNMENVSIREQKSLDDKKKLEEKLNKMMKTLRHSIKNLEDDVDQTVDEAQYDKSNGDFRSGKT